MPNVKITDLPAASGVNDEDVFEKVTLPGSTNASQKATVLQLKNIILPASVSMADGLCSDSFENYPLGAIASLDQGSGWGASGVVSGGTIVSRTTPQGTSQKSLSIIAGQLGRKFGWGDSWNRIQIFVAWRINHAATFTSDGYFGVCSGTTNMVASATTDNFIGMKWEDTLPGGSVYTAGTKAPYFRHTSGFYHASRRGVVTTNIAYGYTAGATTAEAGYYSFAHYDISRAVFANDAASVAYNKGWITEQTDMVETAKTKSGLLAFLTADVSLNVAASLSFAGVTAPSSGLTSNSGNFDQSTGKLDTLNISWPHAHGLEIAALAVRKVR